MKNKLLFFWIYCIINCLFWASIYAQQDAQYTQYIYNTSTINPAYVGSRDLTSFLVLHREQWNNIEGAPTTQTINFDTALNPNNKIGLGVSAIQDRIKPSVETNISLDFSYAITFGEEQYLRFGTKITGNLLNVDLVNLSREEANDEAFNGNIENRFTPNFGLGIYYNTNNFFVGASVPNLLETSFYREGNTSNSSGGNTVIAKERMNFYFITGYVYDLNHNLKFKPAFLAKTVFGAPLQLDFSTNFLFNKKFLFGSAYRWGGAISGTVGYKSFKSLFVGVSFDIETSRLTANNGLSNTSYEFVLRYDILRKINRYSKRIKTPRFF